MSNKIHLTWTMKAHPEGRAPIDGEGCADAAVVLSIRLPEGGGRSQALFALDGRTGKSLSAAEVLLSWATMGRQIAQNPEVPTPFRELAARVCDEVLKGPPELY